MRRPNDDPATDGSSGGGRNHSAWFMLAMCVAMADEPFFPDRIFGRDQEENDFVVEWYSKHLRAMKEPSLWKLAQNDRSAVVYRFLWLPTFDRPVSVRLVKSGESALLDAVELDGRGGYEPGKDRRPQDLEAGW